MTLKRGLQQGSRRGAGGATSPQRVAACRQAYAAMARCLEGDLLRVARRLCGPSHGGEDRARDLVQDTLLRGYEAVLDGQYLGRVSLNEPEDAEARRQKAWLLRILTNCFINDYRRRRKWEAGITVDELTLNGETAPYPALRAASGDRPDTALLSQILDEPLEAALLALPEGMRLCVVLIDIEGLDYAEAAGVLGLPVGTVRSRLSRGRFALQKTLKGYAQARGYNAAVPSSE